ncbi:MAG: GyrI-like domain-containing protein [candidate division Zixibacteria bacterium]|nr:GyrI-like domain-containing protein [candidate division Zixibacteria bacterium]
MNATKDVQVEAMDSMRVARVTVTSENPETRAFQALVDWARKCEPGPPGRVRFFGFNDPCPKPGQKVYEYEAWMTVSDTAREEDDVSIVTHPGRTYAVLTTPLRDIGKAWSRLSRAVKESEYEYDSGPALEEPLTDPIRTPFDAAVMKLYLPIRRP